MSAVCPRGSKCAPLVSALCVSTMCPLCQLRSTMCPRLWTLSAGGLLWDRALRKLHACFLGIHFGSQIQPLQAHPMLEKLFGVYAGIIVQESFFSIFLDGYPQDLKTQGCCHSYSKLCPQLPAACGSRAVLALLKVSNSLNGFFPSVDLFLDWMQGLRFMF